MTFLEKPELNDYKQFLREVKRETARAGNKRSLRSRGK